MFCNIQFVIIFTCLLLATKTMYYQTRMIIFNGNVCHTLFKIIHTNLPNFVSWLLPSLGYMYFKLYQLITTHYVVNH